MVKTVIGGLVGGLASYIIAFLFWGTPLSGLAFSRADAQASANLQAGLAQALTQSGTGVYIIPDPSTAQGTVLYGKGPIAQVFYNSNGFPVLDGASLIGGLILSLAVGLLIAFTLRLVRVEFAMRARIAVLLALAPMLWIHVGGAVFMHNPWGYSLYAAIADFVALAAAGVIAAKLMDRRDGADADRNGTVH